LNENSRALKLIADTTFIIDLANSNSGAHLKLKELKKSGETLAITAVTLFELWQGSGALTGAESKLIRDLADKALIIHVEPENAKLAGIISSKLKKTGHALEARDCLIAGIVVGGGDVLLTRNIKDFSKIEGIRLETY
jgi:tRNA(fMet)-specific endonuclease VapC